MLMSFTQKKIGLIKEKEFHSFIHRSYLPKTTWHTS
jgi:hypothetical protein